MQPEMPLPQTDAVDSAAAQPVVEGHPHRAGFVNIIGNPNVGKSTLMNALVGERLSIITSKAQTTRHRIMGIVNGEDYQIVYSDTPGILKPAYNLQRSMMEYVNTAIGDADIILYVTDVVEKGDKNREYVERLCSVDCPVLIVINKIDLSDQQTVAALAAQWSAAVPHAEVFAVSAQERFGLEPVLGRIVSLLPEGEPWYDKDFFTDRNLRFFASEIIREKILTNYDKEIPYCTEVVIEEFKENAHGGLLPEEGLPAALRQGRSPLAGRQAETCGVRVLAYSFGRSRARLLSGCFCSPSEGGLLSGCFCSPSEGGLLSGHFHSPSEGGISSVCLRMPSELL